MTMFYDHLLIAGISKNEACEIFDITPRTLRRWNDFPPEWAVKIVKLLAKKPPFPESWNGWNFDHDYICDSGGNCFHINDVRSIFFTDQLHQTLIGDQYSIVSLKNELEKRVKAYQSEISVSISYGDQSKLVKIAL